MKIFRILFFAILSTILLPHTAAAQLAFSENKGQWNKQVLYKADAGTGSFFLSSDGYTIVMRNESDFNRFEEVLHGHSHDTIGTRVNKMPVGLVRIRNHAYRVRFAGANSNSPVIAEKPLPGTENYFLGNDPAQWATGCRSYQAITYKNIYPNIDLRYYVQDDKLKYDLIIYPGARLSDIKMNYEGAALRIRNQELVVSTSVGDARELRPFTYQFIDGERKPVNCRYKLNGTTVSFDVGAYDGRTTLIIDPTLVFSTFSNSRGANWGYTATPGADGTMFGGGIVTPSASGGWPVSPGAFQSNYGGPNNPGVPADVGIIRLSADGRTRLYATYLGGVGLEQPHSMVADANGNLVVAGRTNSKGSFPGATIGSVGGGDYDIFVTKINATGTAIIGSLKIGGSDDDGVNITTNRNSGARSLMRSYGDDGRSEVILDAQNNILLASCTRSANFPTQGNPFQATFRGEQDGVVLKINPTCTAIVWSTLLGGAGDDAAFVLAINPQNRDIYVAGGTTDAGLPGTGGGGALPASFVGGEADGFVTQIRDNGTSPTLVRSVYLGTTSVDVVFGIQFDRLGFPYIMGTSMGNWPIINAAYSIASGRQFIAKLRADLSGYVYSTRFGSVNASAPNISPVAFLVDNCENVYVSGWGGGANTLSNPSFPTAGTAGLPVTPDAQQSQTDGSDFYFFVLQKNAASQLYGSFFGQRGGFGGWDHVDGGTSRFDAQGVIYQAACANCKFVDSGLPALGNFPITAGAYSPTNLGESIGGCNLALTKIRFDLSGISVGLRAVGARQLNFCLPATVEFVDTLRQARQYIWIWGDGSPNDTTTANPRRHTFNATGFFDVKVIGIDSNSCNVKDSAILRIRVTTDSVALNFTPQRLPPCDNLTFSFTNTTDRLTSNPVFTNRSFVWIWGDGSRNDTVPGFAPNPVLHTFPGPGTYNVRLALIDSNFCNLGEVFGIVNFQVAATIRAGFRVQNGCVPYNVNVTDTSFGAVTYLWVSSDGQTSTNTTPNFVYPNPGTYSIKQYIYNTNSCNLVDSTVRTFTVSAPPRAGFTYSPNPSEENTPTRFTSTASSDVVRWQWNFGDGETSSQPNPIHQYIRPGTFNVCQVVFNSAGCADTLCIPVESLINTVNELPSAFTPNGDGSNDVFRVRGFGITRMTLRVFNRQGLQVFESRSPNVGWDGTYKGTPQPMDAYAWTLDLEYFTGERVRKKGDVTLIR